MPIGLGLYAHAGSSDGTAQSGRAFSDIERPRNQALYRRIFRCLKAFPMDDLPAYYGELHLDVSNGIAFASERVAGKHHAVSKFANLYGAELMFHPQGIRSVIGKNPERLLT